MPWKLHNILDKDVYKNLRYDRIRFLEETETKGEPHLTLYPDPGNSGDTILNSSFLGAGFSFPDQVQGADLGERGYSVGTLWNRSVQNEKQDAAAKRAFVPI